MSGFFNDPSRNPRTGYKIKIGGPTYQKLVTECGNPTEASFGKFPTIYQNYVNVTLSPSLPTQQVLPRGSPILIPQVPIISQVLPIPQLSMRVSPIHK